MFDTTNSSPAEDIVRLLELLRSEQQQRHEEFVELVSKLTEMSSNDASLEHENIVVMLNLILRNMGGTMPDYEILSENDNKVLLIKRDTRADKEDKLAA